MHTIKKYSRKRNNVPLCKIIFYTICLFTVLLIIKNFIVIINQTSVNFVKFKQNADKEQYKYVLLWTNPNNSIFADIIQDDKNVFVYRNCTYTNCIITANRNILSNYRLFDMIVFYGPDIGNMSDGEYPNVRSPHQKYVFASREPPQKFPLCNKQFDGYFNWTWTYRLDSEIQSSYIVIRDSKGDIVGPKKDMYWPKEYAAEGISELLKNKLRNKYKAVACFITNCETVDIREMFASELQDFLLSYELYLDIYGCGELSCPSGNTSDCYEVVNSYYFYLTFENVFDEDYVTEKLLIPLRHNAVPIVYGTANYTRFLPPLSYLNGRYLGVIPLGKKIIQLINNPNQYEEFFKWKNHYSYHNRTESAETDEYCQICALLNDEKIKNESVYKNFRYWWKSRGSNCKN